MLIHPLLVLFLWKTLNNAKGGLFTCYLGFPHLLINMELV
jgi:hypothetical protein